MSESSKKIIIEGSEKGLFNILDTANKKATELYNNMAAKANEANLSTKDQIKYIEESVKATQRQSKAILEKQAAELAFNKLEELNHAKSRQQSEEIRKRYADEEIALKKKKQELNEINTLLRDHLARTKNGGDAPSVNSYVQSVIGNPIQTQPVQNTGPSAVNDPNRLAKAKELITSLASEGASQPRQNFISQLTDRFFTSNESLNQKQISKFLNVLKSSDKDLNTDSLLGKINSSISSGESYDPFIMGKKGAPGLSEESVAAKLNKATANLVDNENSTRTGEKTNELLEKLIDQGKKNQEETISEDKKNTSKVADAADITPEEILAAKIKKEQDDESQKEGHKKSTHGGGKTDIIEVALGTLLGHAIAKKLEGLVEFGKETALGFTKAEEGESFLAETISQINPLGVPIGAFFGGAMERRNKEQFGVENSGSRLGGLTGKMNTSILNNKIIDESERFKQFYGLNEFGYSIEETNEAREQFARAGGHNINKQQVSGALAAEKGYTLDRSLMSGLFGTSRLTGVAPGTTVAGALETNKDLLLDSTELEDVLKLHMQLIKENSNAVEKANDLENLSMLGQFRSVDSEFFKNPQRLAPIITSINQALKHPQNQFQEAESLHNLSQLNPGASYFELLEMRSKGISQKGFLEKFISTKEGEVGGGENLMLALTKGLNLEPAVARAIVEGRNKNPELFKDFGGSEEELKDRVGVREGKIAGRAKSNVTLKEEELVKIKDAFVQGMGPGMAEMGHQLGQNFLDELKRNEETFTFMGVNFGEKIANILAVKLHLDNPFMSDEDKKSNKKINSQLKIYGSGTNDEKKNLIDEQLNASKTLNDSLIQMSSFSSSFGNINKDVQLMNHEFINTKESVVKFNTSLSDTVIVLDKMVKTLNGFNAPHIDRNGVVTGN